MPTLYEHCTSFDKLFTPKKCKGDLLLFGNFPQGGNTGDLAAYIAFFQVLERMEVDVNVRGVSNAHFQEALRFIPITDSNPQFLNELKKRARLGIVTGGGVITKYGDVAIQPKMRPYEEALECPLAWISCGVDPEFIYTPADRESLGRSLQRASFFGTRTQAGCDFLRGMFPDQNIFESPDIVFFLQQEVGPIRIAFPRTIGINVRDVSPVMLPYFVQLADALVTRFDAHILFLPFSFDHGRDAQWSQEIIRRMQRSDRAYMLTHYVYPTIMQDIVSQLDFVVAMRLHAGVLAANAGVPFGCVGYHAKIRNHWASFGREDLLLFEGKRTEDYSYVYSFQPEDLPPVEEVIAKIETLMKHPLSQEALEAKRKMTLDQIRQALTLASIPFTA